MVLSPRRQQTDDDHGGVVEVQPERGRRRKRRERRGNERETSDYNTLLDRHVSRRPAGKGWGSNTGQGRLTAVLPWARRDLAEQAAIARAARAGAVRRTCHAEEHAPRWSRCWILTWTWTGSWEVQTGEIVGCGSLGRQRWRQRWRGRLRPRQQGRGPGRERTATRQQWETRASRRRDSTGP